MRHINSDYHFYGCEVKNVEKQTIDAINPFVSAEERVRLLHFCARITKSNDAAEDLVQETLLEAWRNMHTLRDVQRREPWIFGIARNICLRWLRMHRRDTALLIQPQPGQDFLLTDLEDTLVDDLDIEIALERKELIELLDRALSLLPPETRMAFIQRYVEASPLAEIASQLGTNASVVAMRLQRGKLILRRILTQEMGQEMTLYTAHASSDDWEVTPLWCHNCGQQHLLGMRSSSEGKLLLKCPTCNPETDESFNRSYLPALKGIRGYKPLYTRLAAWCDRYYRTGLSNGSIACVRCGHIAPVSIQTPEHFPNWFQDIKEMNMWMRYSNDRVVTILCEHCTASYITSLEGLVLESMQGQQFLHIHPRIRTLPRQHLEVDGRAAILTRFESVTDTAQLTIISDGETYEVIGIYGNL